MFEVVKYSGRDKDDDEWSEAPIDTLQEATRIAKTYSEADSSALFTVEEEGDVISTWWKGSQRSDREIGVRRERQQWN